jgi:hypothetical protein
MQRASNGFPRLSPASAANRRPSLHQRTAPRTQSVLALVLGIALTALASSRAAERPAPDKKLIEYGWDVPTPQQMRDDLAAMEKRPFDGLIFRLGGGHNAFVTQPLESR